VSPQPVDVILFGLGRYGGGIARHLLRRNKRVLGVDFDPGALTRWHEAGVPVVYGDVEDAELFAHLPLDRTSWVVSTAPDVEAGRVLLRHLQERGYKGKVAVACRVPDEEDTLRVEGATVILRPFADAAEQAVDALTTAMDEVGAVAAGLPGVRELRLAVGSPWAGRSPAELRIRERFRVSVLAVSRAGHTALNPKPDFRLLPGDRVILAGEPADLQPAIAQASEMHATAHLAQEAEDFAVAEVDMSAHPTWVGQTLAQLELRNRFDVTVTGIRTPDGGTLVPTADYLVSRDDKLVVAGHWEDVDRLRSADG
jgi:Trk K+ transport system NAD-binding subunit